MRGAQDTDHILYGREHVKRKAFNEKEIKEIVLADGSKEYYNHFGELVKAIVKTEESNQYYGCYYPGPCTLYFANSELHREDGPAIAHEDGTKAWYQYGKLHRTNGPAIIHAKGTKEYYQHGQLHREDGPAIIRADGRKEWFQNDVRHREGGPALIWPKGAEEEWYQHGQLHREDGPAIAHENGTKAWYQYGERYREDGPAVIYADGREEWYPRERGGTVRTSFSAISQKDKY